MAANCLPLPSGEGRGEGKSPDVPAAHSMDTEWFAVDAEGRVGLFDTGEDGALPNAAANLGGPADPNFDSLVFHVAMMARSHGTSWPKREGEPPKDKQRLVVVKPLPGLDPAEFEEISTSPLWVGLSRKELQLSKLEGHEQFTAVLTEEEIWNDRFERDEGDEPAGLFRFNRDHGDEPGSYGRVEAPATPLLVDSLPKSARDAIVALRLPVDFAKAEQVHLGDHLKDSEASYWGDWSLRGFGNPAAPAKKVPLTKPQGEVSWLWVLVALALAALFLWKVALR